MIKNNIYKIIFVTMTMICLYSVIETKEYYDKIDELQTENALIENDNNILRSKIEIFGSWTSNFKTLDEKLRTSKILGVLLSKSSYMEI